MSKKFLSILILILILSLLLTSFFSVPPFVLGKPVLSFENICNVGGCDCPLPKCHLCLSSGLDISWTHRASGFHFARPSFTHVSMNPDCLSNQEFVKLIFRPPKSVF